jgi:hypothetical protein
MHRKHWAVIGAGNCVLCNTNSIETRDHLFFYCLYAQACWDKIQIRWDYSRPIPDRVDHARSNFQGHCFMEIFVCAAWNIWKDRNDVIFINQVVRVVRWRVRFITDLDIHNYRVKADRVQPLLDWITSCPHWFPLCIFLVPSTSSRPDVNLPFILLPCNSSVNIHSLIKIIP